VPKFDFDVAWQIGSLVRDLGLTRGSPIVVDVRSFGQPLFYSALPGSVPDNTEWIRRKTIRPLVRCDGPLPSEPLRSRAMPRARPMP
jgi:uncharacterized protein (UPF0303 family)